MKTILVLPGDGVGPEVTAEAEKVLRLLNASRGLGLTIKHGLVGGCAIDQQVTSETPLHQSTLDLARTADAILLGAVGGPQWNGNAQRPESGLLKLRKELGLYANIRPCYFASSSLVKLSPLKESVVRGTDITIELTGGLYFGARHESTDLNNGVAFDTMQYSAVTRVAAKLALAKSPPLHITSVDKANVLASSRLWRAVVADTLATEYPALTLSHMLVDTAAMQLVKNPTALNGIILTSNLFGDILSDEASVIPGSIGLLPSASLSGLESGCTGLFEPVHGSAPDIARQGIANPVAAILAVALMCSYSLQLQNEAVMVERAVELVLDSGVRTRDLCGINSTSEFGDAIVRELDKMLSMSSTDKQGRLIPSSLSIKRRPMTLCEKIICHAAVGLDSPFDVKPGKMVCVAVDWTMASELTWKGMEKTYNIIGNPAIHRNDRFWLAIDHTVDPSINDQEKPKQLIEASETFARDAKLVDFHAANQTILHTEFYRERSQPGMLIIGADSHTCSAGALGAFAVGLGAADVVMPLVTGETWFKVPDTVEIRFVGKLKQGISGKDVILHVLGEFKRNTVGFERAVEYTGPGLKYLSCDARFAISNMTTEFGGIAGVFAGDEVTSSYISKRKFHNTEAVYFQADFDACYIDSHSIDLSLIDSMVALFPSPDNVVHVSEVNGMTLDGVFIGACTTGEEDLILAALVLEQGLKCGLVPVVNGKRKVTPGSVQIVARLRTLGLIQIYENCGFTIGAPGCSYCLGIAADRAGEGEVWLSSQNRNFRNRMGKGSIANLASAATVAGMI